MKKVSYLTLCSGLFIMLTTNTTKGENEMANQTTKPKNRYTHEKTKPTMFSKDNNKSISKTQQHFKSEADINLVMKRYNTSGLLTDPSKVPTVMPKFGDFSNVQDFHSMQNKLIEVKNYFMSLPSETRKLFDNNPQNLLSWIADPKNLKEARELGLLPRDLSQIRYTKEDENGSIIDITDEVIQNRGLFVNGKRFNKDGTLYQEVSEKAPEVPSAAEEGGTDLT